MAVTRRPNAIQHTAAADLSTGTLRIWALVWSGATAATDDLACKNTAGTVLLAIKAGSTLERTVYWPFGPNTHVDGLETDVLTAGTVEYILA